MAKNPYADWGMKNDPNAYNDYSGNAYADWGNKQSQTIAAKRQSLSAGIASGQPPAKQNMPKIDPAKINDTNALKTALRNNQINHDQFIQRFDELSPVPGGKNKYSVGNIAGAIGDSVKSMTYDVPKGMVEGAVYGAAGGKLLKADQKLSDVEQQNTMQAIQQYKAGKINKGKLQRTVDENQQDVSHDAQDIASKTNPRNIIASGANTLSYILPVGRVAELSSKLAKFGVPAAAGATGGFLGGLSTEPGQKVNYKGAAIQGAVQGLAFGAGGLATKNPLSKQIADHYVANENPTPDENKALAWLMKNPNKAMKNYNDRIQEKFGGTNIVAGDEAKYVIPGFDSTKSISYHEPGSALAKVKYDQLLADTTTKDKPVLIMAGGTGAGKTSALKNVGKDLNEYSAVVDTNSNNLPSTEAKIKKAIDSGRKVEIAYVYRDPLEAFQNGVMPRAVKEGRIVGVGAHVDTHYGSYETIQQLAKKYAGNDAVEVKAIVNGGAPKDATYGDVAKLPEMKYNRTQILGELKKEIDNAFNEGKINQAEHATYLADADKYATEAGAGQEVHAATEKLAEPQTVAELSPEARSYLGENASQLKANYKAATNADTLQGAENEFHTYVLNQRSAGKSFQQIHDGFKAEKAAGKPPAPKPEEPKPASDSAKVQSFEQYAAEHGAGKQGYGDAALSRQPRATEKVIKQNAGAQLSKDKDLATTRNKLQAEYDAKVKSGEIRPPTRTEELQATAKGHPDLEATKAAQRLLDKQGKKPPADKIPTVREVSPKVAKIIDEVTNSQTPAAIKARGNRLSNLKPEKTIKLRPAQIDDMDKVTDKSPAHIKQGLEEAKKLKTSDVSELLKENFRAYFERGDTVDQIRAGYQGGTFGNHLGDYAVGGNYSTNQALGKMTNHYVGVYLSDGRVFKFKLNDIAEAIKKDQARQPKTKVTNPLDEKPSGKPFKSERKPAVHQGPHNDLGSNANGWSKAEAEVEAAKRAKEAPTMEYTVKKIDGYAGHYSIEGKPKDNIAPPKTEVKGDKGAIKVLTGQEKAKASGIVSIPADADKAETEQLVEEVAAGYKNTTEVVSQTAKGYYNLDKTLKGGVQNRIPQAYGQDKMFRSSEHTPFYRDFYAEHGKAPTLADYTSAVRNEFEGKSGNVIQDSHEKSIYQLVKDRIDAAKARELAGEQGGYIAPGQPIKDVSDFFKEVKKTGEISGRLEDRLYQLKGNATADKQAVQRLLKGTEKFSPDDLEAAYHYAEDKSHPVSDAQLKIYDDYIKPLQEATAKARANLKQSGIPIDENHIHRIAMEKGSGLEQFLRGESHSPREGGFLRKTTNAMKGRTMKAIEDEDGNRTVVSIKSQSNPVTGKVKPGGKRVTAIKGEQLSDLGALKHPTIPQVTEFYDKHLMDGLNKLANDLGIEHERTNKTVGGRRSTAGISYAVQGVIKTRAGSPEEVILHEIGHVLDKRYDMQRVFNARYSKEIRALADLRFEGQETPPAARLRYIRKGTEKIANMFEVYLHAPDRFKKIAPDTYKEFVKFLRSEPELKPITELKPSMVLGQQTIGDINAPNVFVDKSGKVFKITEATTKEIEANTKTRYYKNPIVNSALDYVATRQAERANQFLEEWKSHPDFKEIALKDGDGVIPAGWQTTKAPQFMGYHFDPKVAEVLDDFAGRTHDDPLEALNAMNRFLRTTIFFNPLIHIPNVLAHWVPNRGLSAFASPKGYSRLVRFGGKAISEVVHAGPLYTEMLRNGAPFMSFDQEKFADQIYKMMSDDMKNPGVAKRMSEALGYADPVRWVQAWYKMSHAATWYSNDILTMQAILEEMDKGKSMAQAIANVGDHIPNYRVPTRILGSRPLRKIATNPNLTMFSSYHYGVLKNYATTVRDLVSRDSSIKDKAATIDKLMAAGVVAFVVYPFMDKGAKKLTGNDNSVFRRAGPFAWPAGIANVAKGNKSPGQFTETVVTPAPGTKALSQLWHNKDSFGNQIFNPGDVRNPAQLSRDIARYAGTLVAPVSGYQRASKSSAGLKKFVAGLFSISQPKSPTDTLINNLIDKQLGGSGQTVQQQRNSAAKAAARQQILEGKGDSLAKTLVKANILAESDLTKFEKEAKWTTQQRAFDILSTTNKLSVLQKASPAERKALIADQQEFLQDLAQTMNNKTAKLTNRQAAKQIIQLYGGNTDQLYSDYKSRRSAETKARKKK